MFKQKKCYFKRFIFLCVTVFIAMGLFTTIAFCAENNLLEFDDSAIISGGAEKFWDGFGYSYKYKNFIFNIEDNESITIYDCDEKAKGTVTIPSELFGYKVRVGSDDEGIGQHIFEDCNNITKIVVSQGIKYIGNGALSGCTSVKEIVLPDSLEEIFVFAFEGCTSLNKINIPDNVKEIGLSAFASSGIQLSKSNWQNGVLYWDKCLLDIASDFEGKLIVKEGTKLIAGAVFDDVMGITEAVLPEGLKYISSCLAMQPCNIEKINIPASVIYIGDCFLANASLEYIDVHKNNKYYCDIDGSLLTKNKEIYIRNTKGKGDNFVYYIPNGVKTISSYAFERSDYEEIKIPGSVVNLESCCFANAYIKKITIPQNIKNVGTNIFRQCWHLENVNILCSFDAIPYAMFEDCESLKSITIPEGVVKIDGRAFEGCKSLTEIRLPSTLEEVPSVFYGINGCLFEDCTNLKNIIVDKNNKYYTVRDGILYNKEMTRLIRCPEAYGSKNVVIPSTVKKINAAAFKNCKNIVSVQLPEGIEYISENLFEDCKNLKKINLPSSVKSIEFAAFRGCESLDITIPKTVIKIGVDSLGFKYDNDLLKIKGFKIKGYKGSAAEAYAKENGLKFESVGTVDKNYSTELNLDVSKQLKWLECESFMEGNTIFLLDSLKGKYVEELIYSSNYMLYDYNWLPIEDEQFIGTGANFILIPLDEEVFIDYFIVRMGDTNGDGLVDKTDLKKAKTYIGRKVESNDFSGLAIDLNYDGKITNEDISLLEGVIGGNKIEKKVFHTYKTVTTKATLTKNGKVESKCSVCGNVKSTTTVYYPKTIKLSATTYTYNGKVKAPAVTVKDSKGNVLKKDTDYTVKYESGRKLPGKYTVTVTFKGKYSGTKKLYFTITPKTTSKVTATQTTTSVTLKWNKVTGATGYRVFQKANGKWKTLTNTTKLTYTIKKLKAGTAYTFAVRPYTVDGKDTILAAKFTQLKTATMCKTPTLKLTSTKKGIANASWTNVAGETGYELYGSSKKSSGFKKLATTKANVVKSSKNKLTSKKTYYFKVRAYTKTDSGTVYSAWSSVKSVKVK